MRATRSGQGWKAAGISRSWLWVLFYSECRGKPLWGEFGKEVTLSDLHSKYLTPVSSVETTEG